MASPWASLQKAAPCEITAMQGECRVAAEGHRRQPPAVIIVPSLNMSGARSLDNAALGRQRGAPPTRDNLLCPASGLLRHVHLCEIHVTRQCAAANLPLAKMLVTVTVRLQAPTETPMQKKNKDKAKHWHDPCPPGGRPSLFGILSMLTGWAPEPSVTRATRTASESWTPP